MKFLERSEAKDTLAAVVVIWTIFIGSAVAVAFTVICFPVAAITVAAVGVVALVAWSFAYVWARVKS